MTAVNPLLSSINSGEFSPRMEARVDFDRYPNAAKMCRNFLLLPQGGLTRRPGSRFVKEIKSSAAEAILLPFEFSRSEAYAIEAGEQYMRFYRRQARLECADISAAISNGTFASNITGWNDPTNLMTAAYAGGTSDATDLTTYTFSGHAIGAAAANRTVVVCVSGALTAAISSRSISSVTVGGAAMIPVGDLLTDNDGTNRMSTGMFRLAVASGTTADIVVTWSGAMSRCRIDVYALTGPNIEPFEIDTDITLSAGVLDPGGSLSIPFGGASIAMASFFAAGITGVTWGASFTEDSDVAPEGNLRTSTASRSVATTGTAANVTATRAGGGGTEMGLMMAVSWGANSLSHDATNQRLVLEGLSTGPSHAEQAVSIGQTSTEHTLRFKVAGFGGGRVMFRVGTTSGGSEIIDNYELGVGEHAISFTPGAATIYVGFVNDNSPVRDMYIDTVAFLDNAPFELVAPYSAAELSEVRYFQAADVAFLTHPDHAVRRLERRGHKSWSLVEAFFEDGPYLEVNPGTNLDEVQLLVNPFFENGFQAWERLVSGNNSNNTKATAPDGGSYLELVVGDNADSIRISQAFNAVPGVPHVMHALFAGAEHSSTVFRCGNTVSGTENFTSDARPKWSSLAFTPTQTSTFVSLLLTAMRGSPLQWHACLCYPQTAKLMQASATTGEITVTALGHEPFVASDVGRLLRLEWPGKEPGYGVITAYTSATVVSMLVLRALPYASVPTENWRLGAWCASEGFPQVIGFFDGRLIAANTSNQPQTIWCSQSGRLQDMRPDSFDNLTLSVEDDDAIAITLDSKRIDPIVWLAEQRDLVVGTSGSQWVISSEGPVITPSDVSAKVHSITPAASLDVAQSNQVAIYLDRSRREVYEIGFSFDDQSYVSTLMTILADHILRSPAHQLTYQRLPHSTVWAPREDGRCATLAYNRQHDILGWAQQILGGAFGAGDPVVEHVAVISGAADATQVQDSDDRDEVWLIVKRTINGATKRYVEVIEGVFEGPLREDYDTEEDWRDAVLAAQPDAFYVDSGVTYDGSATTSITGLSHLEGQTVKVLADGKVHPDRTVSAGAITLAYEASTVQVGLAYKSRYESLKLAVGASAGTAVNKVKAVLGIAAVVLDSGAFKATSVDYDEISGRRQHDLQTIEFRRDEAVVQTAAAPLATGEVNVSTETTYPPDARIYVESDLPTPLTILAFAPDMRGSDARHTA